MLDWIADALIGIFLLSILFAGLGGLIGQDQTSFNLSVFLVLMQLVAIGLWVVSKTYSVKYGISREEFRQAYKWLFYNLVVFFMLNVLVPPSVPKLAGLFGPPMSLASSNKFVTIMISIPEESLFRGWATPWFARRFGNPVGGAAASAGAFMIYHFFVFGTGDVVRLLIVFGAGFVAGLSVLKTRRLSTSMASHFFNNLISVSLRGG